MTILCYHSVQPRWDSPLAVEPTDFDAQCEWLARRRRVLPLREAIQRLDGKGRLPRGVAALTFDDGFEALHEHAMPALTRNLLPSTVFLVAQTLKARGQKVDWVDTPGTEPLTTLTRDQVLDMQGAGIDFQSHSDAHLDLTQLSFEECVKDLADSREFLADLLGRHVDVLAYPRGRHNATVREAAARAGYAYAVALPEQSEEPGPYAIPRVGIYRGNGMTAMRVKSARPYLRVRLDPWFPAAARLVRGARRTVRSGS